MFNWLKTLARKAAGSVSSSGIVLAGGRWLQYPDWNIRAQFEEGYERNSVVYACINLIANTMASITWCLYQKQGSESMEVDDPEHPLLKLLNRPSQRKAGARFTQDVVKFWLITGNSFIWANRIGQQPRELITLRPDRVDIYPGKTLESIDHYVYNDGKGTVIDPMAAEDVLHLTLFQGYANEYYGLSPLLVGSLLIDTDNNAVNWNRNLIGNRGKPDSIFSFKGELSEEQHTAFRAKLDELYSGSTNSGKPLISSGGEFTYQQLGNTPQEMDFMASTTMNTRRICQIYGVAPELVGDAQSKTFANAKEARLALVESSVFPLMDTLQDEFNRWLAPQFGEGLYLEYDKDSVDVISEKRQDKAAGLAIADWLSINEKREAMGYDTFSDPQADVPERLLQVQIIGMQDQQQQDEQNQNPNPQPNPPSDDPNNPNPDVPAKPPEKPLTPDENTPADTAKSIVSINAKLLNLDTEEKKVAFWTRMDAQRRALEAGNAKRFSQHFTQERGRVTLAFRTGGEESAIAVVKARKAPLRKLYEKVYLETGQLFFKRARSTLGSKAIQRKDLGTALRGMIAYIGDVVQTKVDQVTDTTIDKLTAILRKGILGGDSTDTIVDGINSLYDDQFAKSRSQALAVTETGGAVNMGTTFGAESTEKTLQKQWITQRDDAVRDMHADADGQLVELDGLFDVGGEELEFPCDASHGASASNLSNCRCFVAFKEVG